MTLSVLFVCTGNICRSPMAERLLLARSRPASVRVASAGTYGLTGHPMDAQAAEVTRELGADPEGHVARELVPGLVEGANLILTATEEHRDRILRDHPRAMRRTFTMLEFTRLARGVDPSELAAAGQGAAPEVAGGPTDDAAGIARVALVARQRGMVPAPRPGQDDVGDPFGGPMTGMQACGSAIAAAVDDLITILGVDSIS